MVSLGISIKVIPRNMGSNKGRGFFFFFQHFLIIQVWGIQSGNEGTYAVGERVKIDVLEKTARTRQTPLSARSKSGRELLKPAVLQLSF